MKTTHMRSKLFAGCCALALLLFTGCGTNDQEDTYDTSYDSPESAEYDPGAEDNYDDGDDDEYEYEDSNDVEYNEGSSTVELNDSWTDRFGYDFSFELTDASYSSSIDLENSAPGKVKIDYAYGFDGNLVNETPERKAPISSGHYIQPIWPEDSALCASELASDEAFVTNSDAAEKWCTVSHYELFSGADVREIPVDDSISISAQIAPRSVSVEEGDEDAVASDLEQPAALVFGREMGDSPLDDCFLDSGISANSIVVGAATEDVGCAEDE